MRRLSLVVALLALPGPSRAAGLYSEADLGATLFLGDAADAAAPGPALGARLGIAPASWISFGARVQASVHEATVPPPPEGERFQLYHLGSDVRLRAGIGRFGLFAEGGGGVAIVSTNVLDAVGITAPARHASPYLAAGGGLEYRTQNPRFAFGLAGDFAAYTDFSGMQSVGVRFYLRYDSR